MIGLGSMGGAVVAGLLRAGWPAASLRVVASRDQARAADVAAVHGLAPGDLPAVAGSDVVVLAVKPAQVAGVVSQLAPLLVERASEQVARRAAEGTGQQSSPGRRPVVASLAAGIPTAAIEAGLPAGTAVVRVMPNTPAVVGAGMSVLSAGSCAGEDDLAVVGAVLAGVGEVRRVPEHLQDAVTAVSGSGPAYVFYLVDAMTEGGVLLGLDRGTARDLAVSTVLGAGQLLAATGTPAAQLREQVTSPAGTTGRALRVLDERAVRAAVLAAMAAAESRSREIGGTVGRSSERTADGPVVRP